MITSNPTGGAAFPGPYRQIAQPGVLWVKAGRYWVAYQTYPRALILAVFYETANIPLRFRP